MKEKEIDFYPIEGFEHYFLGKGLGINDWSVWSDWSGELKEMKGYISKRGHIKYGLYSDEKRTRKYLHQIIAEQFLPISKELLDSGESLDVHHIDGNPQNNVISNLVWMTHSEHTTLHNKSKHLSEEAKKKMSKQVYQYTLDGELVRVWESTAECGRNGYLQGCVSSCCNGKLKQHKGYRWSYTPL